MLVKTFLGLVEMTSGLVNASFSFPECQAVKMIFFAPCYNKGLLQQGSTVYAYMTKPLFVKAAFITWDHVQKDNMCITGLSKVVGCRQKSPPTWLVSAGYSTWHFSMDSVF